MRKRTVKNGMRLIITALLMIIMVSFYHLQLSELFRLSPDAEGMVYQRGMFWAALLGGYGVMVTVFGLMRSPLKGDGQIRLLPIVLSISALVLLFFYLLSASFDAPHPEKQRRLRPGETITI